MAGFSPPPTKWLLIAGPTGAGKTTIARQTASRRRVIFSIDEWMSNLYWMDCPEKNDYPWAIERVRRCEQQIEAMATQLRERAVDVVLDLGFTTKEQRAAWMERARAAYAVPELEVVNPPADVRWERVCERNANAEGTFSFEVTREMFDAMEALWEPISAEERAAFAECAASVEKAWQHEMENIRTSKVIA